MMSSDVAVISDSQISKAEQLRLEGCRLYSRKDYFDALTHFQKAVTVLKLSDLTPRLKVTSPSAYAIVVEAYLRSSSCYLRSLQYD